jgi:hypothetical protein
MLCRRSTQPTVPHSALRPDANPGPSRGSSELGTRVSKRWFFLPSSASLTKSAGDGKIAGVHRSNGDRRGQLPKPWRILGVLGVETWGDSQSFSKGAVIEIPVHNFNLISSGLGRGKRLPRLVSKSQPRHNSVPLPEESGQVRCEDVF